MKVTLEQWLGLKPQKQQDAEGVSYHSIGY